MNLRTMSLGTVLATVSILGTLIPAQLASASTKGRRNTTIGLGAAALYELLNHKTTNGLILGAGAAYAYKKYRDEQVAEKRRNRVSYYRSTHTYPSSGAYRPRSTYGGGSPTYSRSAYLPYRSYRSRSTSGRAVFDGTVDRETDYIHRRIFVYTNGADRRIVTPKKIPIYQAGQRISVHDLRKGDVLHITGVRNGPTDWRATRIDVLESAGVNDPAASNGYDPNANTRYNSTSDYRSSQQDTSNAALPHYSGVGVIRSVDSTDGSFIIQAGAHTRTVYSQDTVFDGVNGVGDLRPGDRVRVNGDLNGSEVDASQVSLIP